MKSPHRSPVPHVVTAVVMLFGTVMASPATADSRRSSVDEWISTHASPLRTTDPNAPLTDLDLLRKAASKATVVGLGESVHGTKQQTELKVRSVRVLVEQLGFRTIAWEDDWTTGIEIDRYLTHGRGDPRSLVREMTGQWQSKETLNFVRWLRRFNIGRRDKVRFVGVEYYYTGLLAYNAVSAYVAAAAPGHLEELHRHLDPITPKAEDKAAHATAYMDLSAEERAGHLADARQVFRTVRDLPHRPGDLTYDLALHHARQILSFHKHYSLSTNDQNIYREAHAAANLRWWQHRTGHRIAYWAASPHTANAADLRITMPGMEFRYRATGSYLRRWYGAAYLSVGFTLDHGTAGLPPSPTTHLAPPKPSWFEAPLGRQPSDHFILDTRRAGPLAVRRWLSGPLITRGLPQAGPSSTVRGGSVAEWFDVLVHTQRVTPLDVVGK